jgi:hypothetical protein
MNIHTVTLQVPETLYLRLQQAAQATKQSLDEVFLHVVQVGSPPGWDDIPAEFQAEIAALDRLDDAALWRIARQKQSNTDIALYQELLDKQADKTLSDTDAQTLHQLRTEADCFMLRKAQAADILRWRGHQIPPAEKL